MNVEEKKIAHLEMIQGVLNRMAGNSFMLKGWSVTLVAAIIALAQKETNLNFIYLAFFPASIFWFLDAYYLWQEKLYRKLYDEVRISTTEIDYSMDTSKLKNKLPCYFCICFSKTIILFHGVIISSIFIVKKYLM